MGRIVNEIRKYIDEILLESFIKKNTLLNKLRGEIIELEYKNDEVMLQEILDDYELRIKDLEAKLITSQLQINDLQIDKISLQTELSNESYRISSLEVEKNLLEERIIALESKEIEL